MLTKLARNTFEYVVGDSECRKAIAFAIFLKNKNQTSVFKDWTLRSIAKDAGVSPATAKRRLALLRKMHFVRYETIGGHNYLTFKKLRRRKVRNKKNERFHSPRNLDVCIEKAAMCSVKEIEKFLMALHIQEHTRKTAYTKRLISLAKDPAPYEKLKEVKKAKAIFRKRGIDVDKLPAFKEWGYSYRRISKKLHCGFQTVKEIVSLGESMELFIAQRSDLVLLEYVGKGKAKEALPYLIINHPNAFATSNNIYIRPATTFRLVDSIRI